MPDEQPSIVFNVSKRETHHPNAGFKQLHRKLRSSFKCQVNNYELSEERLLGVTALIFGCPQEKFTEEEFNALKTYLNAGGNVMVLLGEGGEDKYGTNINYLLEELGMVVNSDAVVSTVFRVSSADKDAAYVHPKEVLVTDGVLNREVNRAAGKKVAASISATAAKAGLSGSLAFAYPYGATLSVQKPCVALLSSGHSAYPVNRPVVAVGTKGKGRIMLVGSVAMFDDTYLQREENAKLFDVLLKWLLGSADVSLNTVDADDPDLADYRYLPDTTALAERPRACLEECEEVPRDFTTLFDSTMFGFDVSMVPQVVELHEQLGVKHEPLTLIQPQFETPLPPLQPAVFMPAMRDPPPPALDQFDLDEQFASDRVRLAQLTNKCTEEDVDYFVREAADIAGVRVPHAGPGLPDAKTLLHYMLRRVLHWRRLDTEQAATAGEVGMEAETGRPDTGSYASAGAVGEMASFSGAQTLAL